MTIFIELSLLLLIAAIVSFIMKALKQPFTVGYILTGIIAGPHLLNVVGVQSNAELFSKIGIAMLLFIVGLHLNPSVIKEVGKASLITGLGQIVATSAIGYVLCVLIGFSAASSMYVSLAFTFSSTIIILKLLSDKGDLSKLYGKVAVGFLLVQDLVAISALITISALSSTAGPNLSQIVVVMLVKGAILVFILVSMGKLLLPKIAQFAASNGELLFLFSLAWGLGVAAAFHTLGFSIEVGALAAGIVISTSPFAVEIGARMKPLRDFFILLFFIFLGASMSLDSVGAILLPALILSVFVIIVKPLLMFVLMNLANYKRKTAFMTAATSAQISEFSLILITLGVSLGHLPGWISSLTTLVGLITIAVSTYIVLYAHKLYLILEPLLKKLEFKKVIYEKSLSATKTPEIILFGYDRVGSDFVKAIEKLDKPYLVVDYNPASIHRLTQLNIPYVFGDAEDIELLDEIGIAKVKLIVSTVPSHETNMLLIKAANEKNPHVITVVLSHTTHEAQELYAQGATYVVMPHYLGAEFASHLIVKHGLNKEMFLEEQRHHIDKLNKRLTEIL